MANLGKGSPTHTNLLVANALVSLAYGSLYGGCRSFNGRHGSPATTFLGAAIWVAAFPFIHESAGARLVLLSVILGTYAAISAWELWKHAPEQLRAQHATSALLLALAGFNYIRGVLGLSLDSIFWINAFASRWSAEMALFLVAYAPALAFLFLSMTKERIEREHQRIERALRESEEHYRYSVELNPQLPWTADAQANLLTVSPRWQELTGMPIDAALGIGWAMALRPDDLGTVQQAWLHSTATGEPFDVEYQLRLVDGSYRWFRARASARFNRDGSVYRWYGTLEDVHDRKLAEEHLRWAAYHDELTGLPNRRLFQERLKQALDHADRTGQRVGLLMIDLDDFKQINDRFGHDAGDDLLRQFGKCLARLSRPTDTVARLGGDEFAVILHGIDCEAEVAAAARAIQSPVQETFKAESGMRECRASIGGAISVMPGMEVDELLKRADLALSGSKMAGRGAFQMFVPSLREEAQKTASALEVARSAIASDWIVPFYQPKVSLETGAVIGFEALLRWDHPRMGLQTPHTLAPAFEDLELGAALGERMLGCILADMRRWRDAGVNVGRIAINASSAEFRHEGYAEGILEKLRRAGVPPHCLAVEVTETVLLDRNSENVERTLRTLCDAGVTIALDDFGTGYASLSHLKRFPVDIIKIDRSFISDMEVDADSAAIVKALSGLGRSLGIKVIAEGVESPTQESLLKRFGCDWGQGYHFGRPMPAGEVPTFLTAAARGSEQPCEHL